MKDELKPIQGHAIAKSEYKKLIGTVPKEDEVSILENISASFQVKKKCELPKTEADSQRTINALQRQKDLTHKKKLERLKKFFDVLKITNQHHAK